MRKTDYLVLLAGVSCALCYRIPQKADGTEEEEEAEEEEDICLVCCEVRDPDRILRCSNCSGGGSGMGIYHNECLPKPLDSMPAGGEVSASRMIRGVFLICIVFGVVGAVVVMVVPHFVIMRNG